MSWYFFDEFSYKDCNIIILYRVFKRWWKIYNSVYCPTCFNIKTYKAIERKGIFKIIQRDSIEKVFFKNLEIIKTILECWNREP